MTVPTVLVIIAAILAVIEQFRAQGQSLIAWAVLLVCAALLWNLLA